MTPGNVAYCVARSLAIAVVLFTLVVSADGEEVYTHDEVKCVVCFKAIEHMWREGEKIRDHCHLPMNHLAQDDDCDLSNVNPSRIHSLVNDTCVHLTTQYQLSSKKKGDSKEKDEAAGRVPPLPKLVSLELGASSDHTDEEEKLVQEACYQWIHDKFTVKEVAEYIFANLDAQKTKSQILWSLQQRFCRLPCNLPKKKPRKRPPPHYVDEQPEWHMWLRNDDDHELDYNFEHHNPANPKHAVRYHQGDGTQSHTMKPPEGMKNVRMKGDGGTLRGFKTIKEEYFEEKRRRMAESESKQMEDPTASREEEMMRRQASEEEEF